MKSPKFILHLALTIACILFAGSKAYAQQDASSTTPPTLSQELQHLGNAASALDHSLPSFTCQETATSKLLRGKKVERQSDLTATLRVNRTANGTLAEAFTLSTLDGKHFAGGGYSLPVYVAGGFDRAMLYFLPSLQPCYRYTLSPRRIDFETAADASTNPACQNEGIHGFAALDADGKVTHLERSVSPQGEQNLRLAPFAAFDFADVILDGRTYRLSHHLLAEIPDGHYTGRFEAIYTDCHLFTATITIGPATEVPHPNTSQPQ